MNILQYESKIWATAELLRGSGIKESEWRSEERRVGKEC